MTSSRIGESHCRFLTDEQFVPHAEKNDYNRSQENDHIFQQILPDVRDELPYHTIITSF